MNVYKYQKICTVPMFALTLTACLLLTGIANAQTKADSGWVPLWNGENWDGLMVYPKGQDLIPDMSQQNHFHMEDGYIRADGDGNAHLFTIREYSYYHVRITYKFVEDGNAGLIVGAQLNHFGQDFFDGKNHNRPGSIEVNMKRNKPYEPWSLWCASKLGPYITAFVDPNQKNTYMAEEDGGVEQTFDGFGQSPTRTLRARAPHNENPVGEWNYGEAIMMGDSLGIFILNGYVRTQAHNFELRADMSDGSEDNRIPMTKGAIGLQYEGAVMHYKDFEIRSLIGCMDESAANYGYWYIRDSIPSSCKFAGCKDPEYQEYDENADIHDATLCKTVSIKGTVRDFLPQFASFDAKRQILSVTGSKQHMLEVFGLAGGEVFSQTANGAFEYRLSGRLKPGLYLFHLSYGKIVYVIKGIL